MAGLSQLFINHLLPKDAHLATVCGQTGCGKTVFVLSLLEEGLCPTIEHNKTYKQCPWLWTDPDVYVLDPGERLHVYLWAFYLVFKGKPTLFIIDKIAGLSQLFINHLLPKDAHLATVCGQTGCGKTVFVLSLLEEGLCPTIEHNKTYKQCPCLWTDPEVYVLDPGERLHDYLWAFYLVFKGKPTLFIIGNCSDTEALTKKRHMLSELAFLGRHAGISVWVLTQKYNSVLMDLREQTCWVALFHCKIATALETACGRMT